MIYLVELVLRALATILGAALLYVAFFLYEDEEEGMQNKLEEWWISFLDSGRETSSVLVNFCHAVAKGTDDLFSSFMGKKLLTPRSVGFSLTLAMISGSTGISIARVLEGNFAGAILSCWITLFGVWHLREDLFKKMKWRHIGYALSISLFAGFSLFTTSMFEAAFFVALYPVVVAANLFSIVTTRFILRLSQRISVALYLLAFFLADLVLVTALLGAPARFAFGGSSSSRLFDILFYSNFSVVLPSLLYIAFFAALILHSLLWPMFTRSLYAYARLGTRKRRIAYGVAGFALILTAFPEATLIVKRVADLFSGRGPGD